MLVLLTSPLPFATRSLCSSLQVSGEKDGAGNLRATSTSLLGDGVEVLDVAGVVGGDEGVTSALSLTLMADDVMLAKRCWNDPGGGSGSERGPRVRFIARPPGDERPSEVKVEGE